MYIDFHHKKYSQQRHLLERSGYSLLQMHVKYSNSPKFSDRHVWANSVDTDQTALADQTAPEQSDQGLYCFVLLFRMYLLDELLYSKPTVFQSGWLQHLFGRPKFWVVCVTFILLSNWIKPVIF